MARGEINTQKLRPLGENGVFLRRVRVRAYFMYPFSR